MNNKIITSLFCVFCLGFWMTGSAVTAEVPVRLAHIFGDNMVLQRELPVPIWGWAEVAQRVSAVLPSGLRTPR